MNTTETWKDSQLTIFPPAPEDRANHLSMTNIDLSFASRGVVANFLADEMEVPFLTQRIEQAEHAGLQVLRLKDTCDSYSGLLMRFRESEDSERNMILGFIKKHDDANTVGPVICVGGVEGEGS